MQASLWQAAALSSAIGLIAYARDRARRRRRDLDRVSAIDWALVQLLAVLAALVCTALALSGCSAIRPSVPALLQQS